MPWLDDLTTALETAGVGTLNVNIFLTTRAAVPMLPSGWATLHLVDTAGADPTNTHNATLRPAYINPTAQLTARADDAEQADAMIRAAYTALFKIRNQFINSGWYQWVKPMGHIGDLGLDDRGQARFVINVTGRSRF